MKPQRTSTKSKKHPRPSRRVERLVRLADVASGKYRIDMTDTSRWSERVSRLREILKRAAPIKSTEPQYRFMPYYFCKDGYWYESAWEGKDGAVDVFKISLQA